LGYGACKQKLLELKRKRNLPLSPRTKEWQLRSECVVRMGG